MYKYFIFALFVFFMPDEGYSRAVKLGDMHQKNPTIGGGANRSVVSSVSCLETADCPYDKECVALQCENVCKNDQCSPGTHCTVFQDDPHKPKCVECISNFHCSQGMFCDQDFICKKINPCLKAICSPAAPFCMPEPYKTLPYTCVQCLEDSHCPPVAGLTRSCVKGYCLFNIEGNIPVQKQDQSVPATPSPSAVIKKVHQVEVAAPPSRAPVVPAGQEQYDEEEYYDEEDEYYEDEAVFDEN